MADAVVGIGDGGKVTLLVLNRGSGPILLEEGDVLGELQPATLLDTGDLTAEEEVDHGHQISLIVAAISSSTSRAKRERELLTLVDLRSLRAFLGLLSYYRRFVPKFSSFAQTLYNLTRKHVPFVWGSECDTAIKQLKSRLTQAPVLAYPKFGRDFYL